MDNPDASPFRIPESARHNYRRWLTPCYAGWIDVSLQEELSGDQVDDPESLFRIPQAETVRDKRNLTARVLIGDRPVWIKRFRPTGTMDRLVYAVKQGKAVYAWNAAMALLECGFCTPVPLIGLRALGPEGSAGGIIAFEEIPGRRSLRHMLADDSLPASERSDLVGDFGSGLRRFHDLGFRHRDLRQGNVLVSGAGDDRVFCFLDLNRLRIQAPLSRTQRLREVEKLNLPADVIEVFFDRYMPEMSGAAMAAAYSERVRYADRLGHLPLGKLLYKTWYYAWELRAFGRSRRP